RHDLQIPPPEELGPAVYIENPGVPLGPPDNPEVGDSWTWWLFLWQPMSPHFEQSVCTVRGKTDRGYVVVKDEEWLVTIDQADVDSILEHWENSSPGPYPDQGIYEIDSLSFGDPPDELDNDPRIYLMWYEFGVNADGFFFFFDEYPDGTYPEYPSNECEVLYLNPTSSGGASGDYMHAVVAHEFQHMIHWKYDDDESTWVNEGMSELAMWFYGHPDNISSFNGNPDNNLTVWDGNWADYIKTYLWSLYFFEQYGGHATVYALVHEPLNSMAGFDAVLDDYGYTENTEDIFIDWAVANYLDDTTIADGRYGYIGDELPTFYPAGTYSSYPVDATKAVKHWATDYYRFQDIPFPYLELTFDGADDNQYAIRVLVIHDAAPTQVFALNLEGASQSGSVVMNDLTSTDEVILVVTSVSSTGGPTYNFTAGEALGISTDPALSGASLSMVPSINPFSSTVDLQLNWGGNSGDGNPTVEIFDIQGRIVNTLFAETVSEGTASVLWNGELQNGNRASAGIYYARARVNSEESTVKLMLLP
ncbi:MAG: FlgD immunoglobulin-like domain containing protein, partial [Candidatus Fermentibacteria bacterium]|nr:FlgD immunoglobulin-like domain containing protein [Candidatus Fermentibacteria bacterium]